MASEVDEQKRELRQQGAIEAAEEAPQDPQAAEAAEKVLVEETRKAGMPAYQFDPNASPEDKAAAAEAVSSVAAPVDDRVGRSWLTARLCPSGYHPGFIATRSRKAWRSSQIRYVLAGAHRTQSDQMAGEVRFPNLSQCF